MPSLFDAVQVRSLVFGSLPGKDTLDVLVIDHADKTPKEN